MWLLANWKLLAIGAAALAIFGSGWYVSSQIAETRLERALKAQEDTLHAECQKDKAITKGVADDFQNKNAALSRRITALKRVQPNACIVPTTSAAIGDNAAASGAIPAGPHGVATGDLLDLAGEAERYRLQLISCQAFITKTWAAKGQ